MARKDEDIDEMMDMPFSELPATYRRAILRRAKSDKWWDEALQKLERHQTVIVIIIGTLGAVATFREQVSEFFEWMANALGGDQDG